MARMPKLGRRMLWAFLQLGSCVQDVNRPSPARARAEIKPAPSILSKRSSSDSSSTKSKPETTMIWFGPTRSWKIGPYWRASFIIAWMGSPLPVCRRGCPAPDTLVVGGSARRSSQDSSCFPLLEIVVPARDDLSVRQLFVLSGTPASISHAGKGRVLLSLSLCTYRKPIMPGVGCQAPRLSRQAGTWCRPGAFVERVLQELLEAEMTEHIGAAPHERTNARKAIATDTSRGPFVPGWAL